MSEEKNLYAICLKPFKKDQLHEMFSRRFFEYFFTKILDLEMAPHHKDMSDKLINEENKQVFFQAARGHGKSELVSVGFILWLLLTKGCDKPQPYQICLVSSTDAQMRKLFQRIKNYIEGTPMLRYILRPPNIHQATWNEREIITKNNVQLIGKQMGSSIRGLHVEMAILDDVLSDEQADVQGSKDIFEGVISPIVRTKKGRMIVVGTPMSFDDLFTDLFDEEKYPGATRGFYPARLPNGSPQWKTRFNQEELEMVERNMGPIKWSREYMLRPIGAGAMLFTEEIVMGAIEHDCDILDRRNETTYYLGCDVALSGKKSADYSAFTVLERNKGEPLKVKEIWHEKGVGMDKQIEVIQNLHKRYNFSQILIEKVGLSYAMVEKLQENENTRSVTLEFITNVRNKEEILSRLHILLKNKGLKYSKNKDLIDELLAFGVKKKKDGHQTFESLWKHDDMVMSLALACTAAEQHISRYAFELC